MGMLHVDELSLDGKRYGIMFCMETFLEKKMSPGGRQDINCNQTSASTQRSKDGLLNIRYPVASGCAVSKKTESNIILYALPRFGISTPAVAKLLMTYCTLISFLNISFISPQS